MSLLSRRRFLAAASGAAATSALLGCSSEEASRATSPLARPEARPVTLVVPSRPGRDGAGVRLQKSLGSQGLRDLDPFLMLDEIKSDRAEDVIRGFPDHPHRGFETVTYVLAGAVQHRDSVGNAGLLVPGGAQWMTAGRGIVHSEMPQPDGGVLWGLQLWVNLPAAQKGVAPRYQDIQPDRIPEIGAGGGMVRVVAGSFGAERGPIEDVAVRPTMLDVTLPAGGSLQHELSPTSTVFAYVLDGAMRFGDHPAVARGHLAVLGAGASVAARTDGGGRYLLLSGEPIGEPIARRGPFVMNTEAELDRAYADWRAGRIAG